MMPSTNHKRAGIRYVPKALVKSYLCRLLTKGQLRVTVTIDIKLIDHVFLCQTLSLQFYSLLSLIPFSSTFNAILWASLPETEHD